MTDLLNCYYFLHKNDIFLLLNSQPYFFNQSCNKHCISIFTLNQLNTLIKHDNKFRLCVCNTVHHTESKNTEKIKAHMSYTWTPGNITLPEYYVTELLN